MTNKGTKRKAEHESTKVVRRKTTLSKHQLEPEFFRDQRELEDLWKHAYPVGTELGRLDKLYEYNWNFSNLEEAFDEGGVLHGEKVYLFVSTESPMEHPALIPIVIAVVSPFPPSDKIGLISIQRESESRKVVDMKQMKMDWVPYVPLGKRSALVERLKSQIFVLNCVQRRAGLKHLKDERVAEFTYCIPYFYNPFEEDETEESTIVKFLYPVEPPVYCEFDWEFDKVELVMEGVDRLNELSDEMLVYNIMSRLDCTTKELIRTTATISKRWKNLWTSLPHLIFSGPTNYWTGLHGYISFIDNTLNQCPTNLNLKKFKLYIEYSSLVNSEFISRANSWIRYAISRNVEEVDLQLFDFGGGRNRFSYDDELFFNNLCFNRVKLSWCLFDPPNGAISWERLECLSLSFVTLDEDMIEKIISGSPCLESLELNNCYGFRRIDITSKSVKKLVFFGYFYYSDEDFVDSIKINAPYISSLNIKGELALRELVLLNVSSLVEVNLDYSIGWGRFAIFEEVFKGLLESLGHVKDITFGDHCSELLSRLKAGSDTVDDDRDENGD